MAGKKKLLRALASNVWGILFAAGLGVAFVIFPIGDNLRYLSYDLLFIFKTEPPPDDLIIVHIDEASHSVLNQPYDMTWDRRLHAELLDTFKMITCYDVIKTLVRSEKGLLQEPERKYSFQVAKDANKIEIKKAVEEIYKVKVQAVNTSIVRGKLKRVRQEQGSTTPWKKAIVTLKEGQKIEVT